MMIREPSPEAALINVQVRWRDWSRPFEEYLIDPAGAASACTVEVGEPRGDGGRLRSKRQQRVTPAGVFHIQGRQDGYIPKWENGARRRGELRSPQRNAM